ncbi:MAG: S8 family serine peptidase [Phycisphaerae bacterium]|nr:S8 family serine peptidase [Saprospiraceae bacterium]
MRKSLLFLLLLGCFYQSGFAQNPDWRSKIDPKLWDYAQKPDSAVEFFIIMQKKADVSAAKQMRKKEEKGKYVFETLSAFAEKDQRTVRDVLQNKNVPLHSFWIINAIWAKGSRALMEQIAQMPEVGHLRTNPIWHLELPPLVGANTPAQDRSVEWGIIKINADDVWNKNPPIKGSGIVVGGQDTGYEWEHQAIKEKYRGWNGSTADHNYNWHDAIHALINGGNNSCGLDLDEPCDDTDHGTHTMGTMVGSEGNNNIGVAPEAQWIGCRNMEEGDGTPATYIECFEWFVAPTDLNDQNEDPSMAPHVINNSWSCPTSEGCNAGNFPDMEAVVENVRAAGIVVVVSASNNGPGCSTVDSPAAIFDASFSVGATTNVANDDIANYSSRGPVTVYTNIMKPDIAAPGSGVRSCVGTDNNSNNYGYGTKSGTSMAGPHVVGVAALIMCARPDLIGNVDELEDLMRNNAVTRFAAAPFCGNDNANSHPNNVYGWGRVDALAAVNASLPIELLEFTAKHLGKTAQLQWITGSEKECSHFTMQRSSDGFTWKNIGEMPCRGNGASSETSYVFNDPSPYKGLNYYRFDQLDYSGQSSKSPVRALSFAFSGYNLRVTSGQGLAYFEVVGEDANENIWRLEIRSMDGREVQNISVGEKGWLKLPDSPSGLYSILLRDVNGRAVAVEKWLWVQ